MEAILALEDGSLFHGRSFTGAGEATAEVCFNTSMTGYQEILTDPSYKLQMVAMTYPLIGNYGINDEDMESSRIHLEAFIVKEYQDVYSNWRANRSLAEFLKEYDVLGVEGIDTRALTRRLRIRGAMKGVVSTNTADPDRLVRMAKEWAGLDDINAVKLVTTESAYRWKGGARVEDVDLAKGGALWRGDGKFKVVAFDYGIKYNILRHLERIGGEVLVLPADAPAEAVEELAPDGIFLSNGPGDPAPVKESIAVIAKLVGKYPMFGICLGQQLLGLALGGRTYKLKFGHRGGNQPVKDLRTGKVAITAQNHSFCVDVNSLDKDAAEITQINLNDNTPEGLRHKKLPLFSVQYHPENSPGPHDAHYLFDEFAAMMEGKPQGF